MTSGAPKIHPIEASPNIYPEYGHELSPTLLKWCPLRAVDIHALKDVGMFVDNLRLYHHDNHPVKWVKLVGVVVGVDEFFKRKVYIVDDGSGACVECTCVAPEPEPTALPVPGVPSHLDQAGRSLVAISGVASRSSGEGAKQKVRSDAGSKGEENEPEGVKNPKVPWDEIDVGTVVKVKGRVGAFRDIKQVEVVRIEVVTGTVDSEVKFWDEALRFKRDVLGTSWSLSSEQLEKCKRKRDKLLRSNRRGQVAAKGGVWEQRRAKDGERDRNDKQDGRGDTARRMLEEEREKMHAKDSKRKWSEAERKEESEERGGKAKGRSGARFSEKDKVNYPSLAVRRAAAGKYAALGI